jgi:hypothetical protein
VNFRLLVKDTSYMYTQKTCSGGTIILWLQVSDKQSACNVSMTICTNAGSTLHIDKPLTKRLAVYTVVTKNLIISIV